MLEFSLISATESCKALSGMQHSLSTCMVKLMRVLICRHINCLCIKVDLPLYSNNSRKLMMQAYMKFICNVGKNVQHGVVTI